MFFCYSLGFTGLIASVVFGWGSLVGCSIVLYSGIFIHALLAVLVMIFSGW